MTVRFLSAAEKEMITAARYYESQSFNLGGRFLSEVENAAGAIAVHPRAGMPLGYNIRRRLLRSFPFALLYAESSEEILIIAVMDLRRDPDYWKGRL